jgi:elongation factor G
MKVYPADRIRNVALIAHGGSGKTTLADAALFNTGAVNRMGRVDDGSSVVDTDPDELKRHMSLALKVVPLEWQETKINLLDTPGYADFVGEVKSALRVADGAVVLVTAEKGVEVGTELTWRYAEERKLPRMVFITKLDRENSSFDRALTSLREHFGKRIAPLHVPIGAEAAFRGIVDICANTAYTFADGKAIKGAIPADMTDQIAAYREQLVEAAVESDDALMMKYLEGEAISDDELCGAIKAAVQQGALVPVLAGSLTKNIGVSTLLDAMLAYFPAATVANEVEMAGKNQTAALVFKTIIDPQRGQFSTFRVYQGTLKPDAHTWNARTGVDERISQLLIARGKQQEVLTEVPAGDIASTVKLSNTHTGDTLSVKEQPLEMTGIAFPKPAFTTAIAPKSKGDLDKLSNALTRVVEEDPTIHVERDHETAETLLSGMGEAHIDITIERMQRKFGVEVEKHDVHVPYRETIRKPARANGRFKRQGGGHGQFGDVTLEIEPLPVGGADEFLFENKIVGGVVPREYVPGVEKGVRESLKRGFLAGYPMLYVRVALVDGKYHPVDSSSQAFEIAGSYGMQEAVPLANPVLLEPVMQVTITIPEHYLGDVSGDLNTKRARIQGMESLGDGYQHINALVPMAEMLHYATDLRSITQGRGVFSMEFAHYEETPANVQQQIIEALKKTQASFAQSNH